MSLSDAQANATLDLNLGDGSPGTVHIGLHLAAESTAVAAAGQNQITVDRSVAVGEQIVINPLGPTSETRTVTAVSGAGPFTLTLNANLTNSWVAGTYVSFRPPSDGATYKEPTGGAYARVSLTNNAANFPAAAARAKTNGAQIQFVRATAQWGLVTHVLVFHGASGGSWRRIAPLAVPQLVQNGSQVTIPAGDLDFIAPY